MNSTVSVSRACSVAGEGGIGMSAELGLGQPDDLDENTVKGLRRTLQNLEVSGSLASLDA